MTREEAIEVYHGLLNQKIKEAFEVFAPELRESEDERIRKAIVALIEDIQQSDKNFAGVELSDMLVWLEKQKEASKAIEAVEKIDKYIDEHLANAHDMKDSNPDKRYYSGWDDALGEMAGILQDVYSEEKQKELKPAEWMEAKEKEFNDIRNDGFDAFRDGFNTGYEEGKIALICDLRDWIKESSKRKRNLQD